MAGETLSGGFGGLPIAPWQQVDRGLSLAYQKANEAWILARDLVEQLSTFTVQPIATSATITPPPFSTAFQHPVAPTAPNLVFDTSVSTMPAAPTFGPVGIDALTDPPTFTAVRPSPDFTGQPEPLSEAAPGAAPTVGAVTVPTAPSITIPEVPSLISLNLPAVPSITLPTFTATAPTINFTAPDVQFFFTEAPYSSAQLTAIQAKISAVLSGGSGLTPAIETAIWERARERENDTLRAAEEQVAIEYSARGFSIPPGMMSARLTEVRQANQAQSATLSRETAIKSLDIQLDMLKQFVQYGIQLESTLMDMAQRTTQRAFEAARFTHEAAIQIFDAKVRMFNAQVQEYQVQAQVWQIQTEAQFKILEKYRLELEGQKLIGEINQQTLEAYNSRVRALLASVEVYRAQIEGVRAQVELDQARVQAFRVQIDAYVAKVQAKAQEWSAWEAKLRAEATKVNIYEADARVFAELVRAHGQAEQTKIERGRLQIQTNELLVRQWEGQLRVVEEKIRAESARIQAGTSIFDGQTRMFAAQVSAEEARVRSDVNQMQLVVEVLKSNAQLALENAKIQIQQAQQLIQVQIEALKGATTAATQLAGSSLAAIHVEAGVRGSSSYNENLALG